MAPIYQIALIQFDPKPVAVTENFNTAAKYIRDAASKGCDLALLPEYHLTSWVPEHPDFLSATRESASFLAKYQELARELNINIVPGTICEFRTGAEADKPEELHNMAHFLAAGTGDICSSYQKKNLWHPERPHLTSSRHSPHVAFDTPLRRADGRPVRAGMLICWDLAFPEAFRALVADGADLILIPSFWYMSDAGAEGSELNPNAEKLFLETATTLRAFENTAAVAFCNAGGLSCVAMPIQGPLGRIGIGEERMEIVPVDLDVLRVAEENYKIRMDMQDEAWHYSHTLRR
ncbi:carbon-nitrogen hydrolase [Dactylonectria macrodidyma]|uniref:Carbon-nitrogen hydrolase n=1 Tax=Dactylonectria macrodidyma TaxID=307937 RepID=A0A9P9DLJ5_9HYPO|nr:carbon-nitrogen hydrolase [Dactylonectria macrodidyma]